MSSIHSDSRSTSASSGFDVTIFKDVEAVLFSQKTVRQIST